MAEPRPIIVSQAGQHEALGARMFCTYCGAPVNPDFYFCNTCSTPYQPPEAVLPAVRPIPLTEGQKIELEAPHVMPLFWVYFTVVLGIGVIAGSLFSKDRPDLQLFMQTVAITITTGFFAAYHWRALVPQFQRIGFDSKYAWFAILLLFPALGVNFAWHKFLTYLLPEGAKSATDSLAELPISWFAVVAIYCIFPAIMEEISFRGLVQHWLMNAIKPIRALLIASALFTALHFSVVSAPYLFIVGMLLGWAKLRTGSLYPSILIHFLHNFLVISFFRS